MHGGMKVQLQLLLSSGEYWDNCSATSWRYTPHPAYAFIKSTATWWRYTPHPAYTFMKSTATWWRYTPHPAYAFKESTAFLRYCNHVTVITVTPCHGMSRALPCSRWHIPWQPPPSGQLQKEHNVYYFPAYLFGWKMSFGSWICCLHQIKLGNLLCCVKPGHTLDSGKKRSYQTTRRHIAEDGNRPTGSLFRVNGRISETSINLYQTTRRQWQNTVTFTSPPRETSISTKYSLMRNRNFKDPRGPGLRLPWPNHFVVNLSFDCMKITSG